MTVKIRKKKSKRQKKVAAAVKDQIVHEARQMFQMFSPDMSGEQNPWGTCVYSTAAFIAAAQRHGYLAKNGMEIVPQAGSAFWRRLPAGDGDGDDALWGYEYDVNTVSPHDPNGLPREIHVWAAIPATNEIIDICTGDWPQVCHNLSGLDWPGPKPPDYMWRKASSPPAHAVYVGNHDATVRAHMAILTIWNHWQKGIRHVPPPADQ